MIVQNPEDTFLIDLSLAYAGERIALRILEEGAGELADGRARAVLARHAEETRAQIRDLERVFSLFDARPQPVDCPAMDGIRRELHLFRQQDPAPRFLTATTLLANLKIEHNGSATYTLLIDKAVMLGRLEAAWILTTILKQKEEAATAIGRLIHELLLELVRDSGPATNAPAAGDGTAPQRTAAAPS